jgi:hypothetical protein
MRDLANTRAAVAHLSIVLQRAADDTVEVHEAWAEVTDANLALNAAVAIDLAPYLRVRDGD